MANNSNDTNKDLDIIILDDDDFIQTTLNMLDKLPKSNFSPNSAEKQAESEGNILIDLTCDFDLNDLFQMHSNGSSQSFPVSNYEIEKMNFKAENSSQVVKNEFGFKVKKNYLNFLSV